MKSARKTMKMMLLSCLLALALPVGAMAAFPERPVTIVVPWGAGGGADIIARSLAKPLEKALGKPVVIVNKEGGSGTIGSSYVAHSKPDGYTIGLINNTGVIHQIHYGGVDYKREDLTPLCLMLRAPIVLAVNSKSPIKTLKEYVEYAKANPGKMTVGMAAIGGGTHLPIERFFRAADIKVQPMPFKGGGGGAVTALVGKHIQSVIAHPSELYGQFKAGNLRLLAVAEEQRLPNYPDLPTFREQGYEDIVGFVWRSFLAPKDIPADVKAIWVKALAEALKSPEYLAAVERLGDMPWFVGPEESAAFIDKDDAQLLQVIKDLGLYQKNTK